MKLNKKIWVYLALIILFGLFLRAYGLGSESIYVDELYNIRLTSLETGDMIKQTSLDAHPPAYYVLFKYWSHLFGTSEIASRSISLLFGFFSIFIVFLLARQVYNSKTALLSSFIAAVFTIEIFFSQYARMYAMLSFFSLCSIYFFIRLVHSDKKNNSILTMIGYIISSSIIIYTHVMGFLILFIESLLFFIYNKEISKNKKKIIISAVAIFILYLHWAKFFIPQLRYMLNFFSMKYLNLINGGDIMILVSAALALALIIFVIISYSFLRTNYAEKFANFIKSIINNINCSKTKRANYIFFLISLAVIIIYAIFIPKLISVTFFRAVYFIVPYIIIFFAHRFLILRQKNMKYLLAALFLIINFTGLIMHYSIQTNADWRNASPFLDNHVTDDDIILFDKGTGYNIYSYYSQISPDYFELTVRVDPDRFNPDEVYFASESEILEKISAKKGVWLVLWRNWRTEDQFKEILDKNLELNFSTSFEGITIYYYNKI